MRDATRLIQAVYAEAGPGEPMLPGPVFAAPYHSEGEPTRPEEVYARFGNPTWARYEQALAALESGPCLVFASGMAAVSALLFATLRPGDVAVLPADGYHGVRSLCEDQLSEVGVEVRLVSTADVGSADLSGARLVLLESPSNPGLDVCDIAAVAETAHAAGAIVALDNTTATVLGQRPLALGADYSVSSDTKALTGHSDLLLGHVAARSDELLAPLRCWRDQAGAVPGPLEVWLAHRSLATLDVRLARQCASALCVAEALERHPAVRECRYPGLPSDPSHEQASRQMALFGPIVSFTLPSRVAAERWLAAARLVVPATSFGGVHSTAERRGRWPGEHVPDGFVRLSIGLEDAADLVDDVVRAVDAATETR